MNAEILAVGTELLLGDILNTDARFLARELAEMGFSVLHQGVVGDNPERLAEAMRLALSRSDILIASGGLGPTGDDLTRETAAGVLGLPLVEDAESLRRIEEHFKRLNRPVGANNRKQAMVPRGSAVLTNDWGTAPGSVTEQDGKIVILLPGPPRELEPLFRERVRPYLARFASGAIESVTFREFGIPESKAEEMLRDLMESENPTFAPYAKDGEVLLRATARAATPEEARALCRPLVREAEKRLGDAVYGEDIDGLEQAVVAKLREKGLHIGLAESCTGGLVAQRITSVPGSSECFECGAVTYANRVKHRLLNVGASTLRRYGAVSPQTAVEMAEGAKALAGAEIGVGITGIAGPGGGTPEKPVGLVYVAVCGLGKLYVKKLTLGHGKADERGYIRFLASSHALDMVRRLLNSLPQPGAEDGARYSARRPGARARRALEAVFPVRGDGARESARKLVLFAAALVFLACAGLLAHYYIQAYLNRLEYSTLSQTYRSASSAAASSKTSSSGDSILPQFAKLHAENPELRGWITIPKTGINLPVVQASDNSKYLTTDFSGKPSRDGTPFLDFRDSVRPDSQNLIVYGHNMQDGQMFEALEKYVNSSGNDFVGFYNSSPLIEFDTLYERSQWKIFAVFVTMSDSSAKGALYYLDTSFPTPAAFDSFISAVRQRSFVNTQVDVQPSDTLLTLSTCNYDYFPNLNGRDSTRLVVMARKVRKGESTAVPPAVKNPNVLYPQPWVDIWNGKASK